MKGDFKKGLTQLLATENRKNRFNMQDSQGQADQAEHIPGTQVFKKKA